MSEKINMETLKAQIAECRSVLEELEARAQSAEGSEKARYEEQIGTFQKRLIDVQNKLLDLQAGSGKWDNDLRKGAGSAWRRLKKGLTDAKTEFKKGYDEGLDK